MKSILLSIKPEWVAKILNGEKTIEVRKKFPKDYVGWVYLYCSNKHNGWCMVGINGNKSYYEKYSKDSLFNYATHRIGNKRVVARFWCDKVEEIKHDYKGAYFYPYGTIRYMTDTLNDYELLKKSCLDYVDLWEYLYVYSNCDVSGYAIHISKLEIFDRPKELSEFRTKVNIKGNELDHIIDCMNYVCYKPLTKAPQNYCYIEGE